MTEISQETIEKFKLFFTKEQEDIFHHIWAKTTIAIDALEKEPYSDPAFRPAVEGNYPRGDASQMDFTILGAAILLVTQNLPDESELKNALKTLPKNLDKLKENLLIFLKEDKEPARKIIFQQSIDYINKIIDLLKEPSLLR